MAREFEGMAGSGFQRRKSSIPRSLGAMRTGVPWELKRAMIRSFFNRRSKAKTPGWKAMAKVR
jgi:hypothetical protein